MHPRMLEMRSLPAAKPEEIFHWYPPEGHQGATNRISFAALIRPERLQGSTASPLILWTLPL